MHVTEVARELGVSTRTVYRLIQGGNLPAKVVTRNRPVTGYDVDESLVSKIKEKLQNKKPTINEIKYIIGGL